VGIEKAVVLSIVEPAVGQVRSNKKYGSEHGSHGFVKPITTRQMGKKRREQSDKEPRICPLFDTRRRWKKEDKDTSKLKECKLDAEIRREAEMCKSLLEAGGRQVKNPRQRHHYAEQDSRDPVGDPHRFHAHFGTSMKLYRCKAYSLTSV